MATNRILMNEVSRALTADGGAQGLVTLTTNTGIYPQAKGHISSGAAEPVEVQVIERVGTTQVRLRRLDNPYGGGADLSAFLVADGAFISFIQQPVPFGSVEQQRAISEERYVNVDGDTMVGDLELPNIQVDEHVIRPIGVTIPDGDISLDTDYVLIDGSGNINTIVTPTLEIGLTTEVVLKFNDEVTIHHMDTTGSGLPIHLGGQVDLTLYAGDTLTLVLNGGFWQEKSRSRPHVWWKSHRVDTMPFGVTNTWIDVEWDLLIPEETTPAVAMLDGSDTTLVIHNYAGLINIEGCYRPVWTGEMAGSGGIAMRVVKSNDGGSTWEEARCLQSYTFRERQEDFVNTKHFAGTMAVSGGTLIKVQAKSSTANIELTGPSGIFDNPVAISLNMFGC